MPRDVKVREVENFIRKELCAKLQKDLRHLRMVKEADLECCVYFHLRNKLAVDANWKIFARKHAKPTGHFIDLLIFKRAKPKLAIELKWNKANISEKDTDSLQKAIDHLRVHKAYFISTIVNGNLTRENREPLTKPIVPNKIVAISIPLALDKGVYKEWHEEKRKYGSRMKSRQTI